MTAEAKPGQWPGLIYQFLTSPAYLGLSSFQRELSLYEANQIMFAKNPGGRAVAVVLGARGRR